VIRYSGWPKDLVAAGVITRAMVLPSGKHPRAADGCGIRIRRYFRLKRGRPQRYLAVFRGVPAALVDRFPGVREAIKAKERYLAWRDAPRRANATTPVMRQLEQTDETALCIDGI